MKDLPDLKDLTLRKIDIRLPGKEDSNGYLEKRIQRQLRYLHVIENLCVERR